MFIRTGSLAAPGVRVVSGLVLRFGTICFIADNAGDFGNKPCPRNGCLVEFGDFECYVATTAAPVRRHPREVLEAEDPPAVCAVRGRRTDRLPRSVEVMTGAATAAGAAAGAAAGKAAPEVGTSAPPVPEPPAKAKSKRMRGPPLERPENIRMAASSPLRETIQKIADPVVASADPVQARAELEAARLNMLEVANQVQRAQLTFEINQREYNVAHGFTPVTKEPSKLGHVRDRGGRLQAEISKDGRTAVVSRSNSKQPRDLRESRLGLGRVPAPVMYQLEGQDIVPRLRT